MPPYFYVRLIYYVFISILAAAMLILQVKIYQHARRNHLSRVLRWAIPGLANALLATVGLAIDDICVLMNLREPVSVYVLTMALNSTGLVFCLTSIQRLWEMVQTMSSMSSTSEGVQKESGVWPPPPTQ